MKDPTTEWVSDNEEGRYDPEKHRKERAERGFSTYDWWNFNSYLSFVITGGLKKFRENGVGHPGSVTEDEWNAILDKMIAGFEAQEELTMGDGWDAYGESYEDWSKPLFEKWDEGSALFVEYYAHLWD